MTATATATVFNREPSKLLAQTERGTTIMVEKNGQATAALIPQPHKTSGAEFARRLARMKPQPETADAVEAIIRGMDEAK
jgi:antitoxin (DNA-binding transcriptional repressor) of toxin-antitoxin stability system